MATVIETRRAFLEAAPAAPGAIDAGEIETIDLVGIQLIVAMLNKESASGTPRLSALSDAAARAFERAGAPLPTTL